MNTTHTDLNWLSSLSKASANMSDQDANSSGRSQARTVILGSDNWSKWKVTTIAILSVKNPDARDHLMGLEQPVPANNNAGTVKAFLATEAACAAQITSTIDDNNFVKVQTIFESAPDADHATPFRLAFRLLQNHHVSQSASVVRNAEDELNGLFFPSTATPDSVGTWLAMNQRLFNTINSHGGAMTPRNFVLELGVVARVPQDTTYGAYINIVLSKVTQIPTVSSASAQTW